MSVTQIWSASSGLVRGQASSIAPNTYSATDLDTMIPPGPKTVSISYPARMSNCSSRSNVTGAWRRVFAQQPLRDLLQNTGRRAMTPHAHFASRHTSETPPNGCTGAATGDCALAGNKPKWFGPERRDLRQLRTLLEEFAREWGRNGHWTCSMRCDGSKSRIGWS